MISFELITLSLVIIINLVIVWVIASQGWHVVSNRYFAIAAACCSLWACGMLLVVGGTTMEVVNIGRAFFAIPPVLVVFFLSMFAAVFPKEKGKAFTLPNKIFFTMTVPVIFFLLINPESLVPTVTLNSRFNLYTVDPFWYQLYNFYYSIGFATAFGGMILHIRSSRGAQRQKLLYVLTGTMLCAGVSTVTNLILPLAGNSQFVWVGPTSTLFYVITISISIVKHQLFDVKLAAVRSIAYVGVLLTLSVIYYAFAYVLSLLIIGSQGVANFNPFNIALALVLAFLFQPIKGFFDRVTNSIFYRDTYKSEVFFAELSDLLTSTIDLHGLLERASRQIAATFKAEQVSFFLYYVNIKDHHMSAGTRGHSRIPIQDMKMLDAYALTTSEGMILSDMLPEGTSVRRMLQSHGIALVMPLRKGGRIAGYVMLGEHRSGNYTKRDINVLMAVRSELLIAIQNALSLHEVKELNATLQQRINVATKELRSSNAQLKHLDEVKDEFMSMASHQLRTPLTSIKGYLSMVLEGDVGKVNTKQDTLLREAFNSSERMVGLVGDFLNVSRLQTGRFIIEKAPFDMRETVKQEVEDLELIAKSHGLRLRLKLDKGPMIVVADQTKIRQVIMNFVDNAIYYSRPKSTIVINLERMKDDVALTVVDTGIGVPEEEQGKLFTKFFRAQNARKQRPDGTGVGLYLAHRVVSAHNGTIIFSSKEGKGSTFGFRIPLSKNPLPNKTPVPTEPTVAIAAEKQTTPV